MSNQMKGKRNPAEMVVLGCLGGGPAHGYYLAREIGEYLGRVWRMGQSRVYALLSRLERDGLVRHTRKDQERRHARKVYAITPEGRRADQVPEETYEQSYDVGTRSPRSPP